MWRWCSRLGLRGSGSTSYSGELAAKEAGNTALWMGMATGIGQPAPVPAEPPRQRSRAGHSPQGRKELDTTEATCVRRRKAFLRLWQLRAEVKVAQLLGLRGPWTASMAGVMALPETFFKLLVAGSQKASLASLSP